MFSATCPVEKREKQPTSRKKHTASSESRGRNQATSGKHKQTDEKKSSSNSSTARAGAETEKGPPHIPKNRGAICRHRIGCLEWQPATTADNAKAAAKAKQAQRRPHPGDVSLCATAEGALADTHRNSWALNIFLALDVVPQVLANLAVVCTALHPTVPMMQLSKPKNVPKGSRGQVPHLRSVCSIARC